MSWRPFWSSVVAYIGLVGCGFFARYGSSIIYLQVTGSTNAPNVSQAVYGAGLLIIAIGAIAALVRFLARGGLMLFALGLAPQIGLLPIILGS